MRLRVTAVLVALCTLVQTAEAQEDVAAFFKDRTVRIIVGSAAGGGYDVNARALARHWPSHIPGKPTIIVQNQPGAGSLPMTNQLYANGPKDGSVIGAPLNGVPTAPLLTPEQAKFDPRQLIWIGSTNRDTQLAYVWHTAPVQSLADLLAKDVVVGATTPGSTQVDYPVVAREILGVRFKVVSGYKGIADIHLAMEAGEVQGIGANGWLGLKVVNGPWIAEKKVRPIVQYGLDRHPDLTDVPTVFDIAKTEADRQALRLMAARLEYGRPFFLPPNVPPARAEALRRAFDATMKDPAFLAEAARSNLDVSPMSGVEVTRLVHEVLDTPTAVVDRLRAALARSAK